MNTNIPYVADDDEWSNLTTGAYVWYDNRYYVERTLWCIV